MLIRIRTRPFTAFYYLKIIAYIKTNTMQQATFSTAKETIAFPQFLPANGRTEVNLGNLHNWQANIHNEPRHLAGNSNCNWEFFMNELEYE